jgi:hypothetical protein
MLTKKHIVLLCFWGLLACSKSTQTTENETSTPPTLAKPSQVIDSLLYQTSPMLQTIWGDKFGKLRGFVLGDSIQKVLQKEQGILAEDSTAYKGFTQSFDPEKSDEFVDIMYNIDQKGIVTGIDLEVYLNSQAQTDRLLIECRDYCNKKYGLGLDKKLEIFWKLTDTTALTLRDMSIKKLPGFQIKLKKIKK